LKRKTTKPGKTFVARGKKRIQHNKAKTNLKRKDTKTHLRQKSMYSWKHPTTVKKKGGLRGIPEWTHQKGRGLGGEGLNNERERGEEKTRFLDDPTRGGGNGLICARKGSSLDGGKKKKTVLKFRGGGGRTLKRKKQKEVVYQGKLNPNDSGSSSKSGREGSSGGGQRAGEVYRKRGLVLKRSWGVQEKRFPKR